MKRLLSLIAILWVCLSNSSAYAQEWMNGYSYRKKLTVEKSRVAAMEGITGGIVVKKDLTDFPVLIEIQDDGFIHIPGSSGNKITDKLGRDISFALTSSPSQPLNFQLEHYDPVRGKLTCWVRINTLSANGTASPATTIYLYYGSSILHDPFGLRATNVWPEEFTRVWHLNLDISPAVCRDAQSGITALNATGSTGTGETNFTDSKIATGLKLARASTHSFSSASDTSTNVSISSWVQISDLDSDQVIIANDSVNGQLRNGYVLKINAAGNVVMELYRSMTRYAVETIISLELNKWYHVTGMVSGNQLSIILNGVKAAGKNNIRLGKGGSVQIGCSKQGTQYFQGFLDEIRIQNAPEPREWLLTQFINQESPQLFCSIEGEEYNPAVFTKYTGPSGGLWAVPSNWSNVTIPTAGSNVIIPCGKSLRLAEGGATAIGSLMVKSGSELSLGSHLHISSSTKIDTGAAIKLDNDVRLSCGGDLINNGNISLSHQSGTLVFSGSNRGQQLSGSGLTRVYRLKNNQALPENELIINAPMEVSGYVELTNGMLISNGNLTLLSTVLNTAAILPIPTDNASIKGDINVQQYISGGYGAPANARNWRLLSSPVYTDSTSVLKQYSISAFQKSMFITGPGGPANGFDPSPLNSGTIYVHDQSLPGNLAQKYQTIDNTDARIELGKGVYVFSRGLRTAPDAYRTQIAQSPFSNPDGYYITYTGKVYSGDLTLQLRNENTGAEGDGFNLLGNPYPGTLLWGSLIKNNLSPYIWQYDPVNRDYMVNDSAETKIPAGTGFFVKVISGQSSGMLTFTENAKLLPTEPIVHSSMTGKPAGYSSKISSVSVHTETADTKRLSLTVTLTRKSFSQQYRLYLSENGNNSLDDQDAVKIGTGYIHIAGITNNTKIAIEDRSAAESIQKIQLYTNGWEDGTYSINIKTSAALYQLNTITLTDTYLKKDIVLEKPEKNHSFEMVTSAPGSRDNNRFIITLDRRTAPGKPNKKAEEIIVYPNPVADKLYFKFPVGHVKSTILLISDILGNTIMRLKLKPDHSANASIDCMNIPKGLYFATMLQEGGNKIVKRFKLIKE